MTDGLRNWSRFKLVSIIGLWLLTSGTGIVALARYASRPGQMSNAAEVFPPGSRAPRTAGKYTLIMLAHPRCACTRASLHELARLLDRVQDKVEASIFFVRPKGVPAHFEDTDLMGIARAIPNLSVFVDEDGSEARRLGAQTSGQVMVYDPDGKLQFRGGITAQRGHEGDSPGGARILSLVETGHAELAQAPVFGCSLLDPENGEAPQ